MLALSHPSSSAVQIRTVANWLMGLTQSYAFPPEVSLFGIAQDGKPVLLHLRDPRAGAILVTGSRTATTTLLQTAGYSALALNGKQAGVAVITSHPEDWELGEQMSIFSDVAPLENIALFIREAGQGIILLLVEDYELVNREPELFKFICEQGPQRMVWTICTAEKPADVPANLFRTRIAETSAGVFWMRERGEHVYFSPRQITNLYEGRLSPR